MDRSELFKSFLENQPEGTKCLTRDKSMYFIIYDYDVLYFNLDGKNCLEINTYPIEPKTLGETLFKVSLR